MNQGATKIGLGTGTLASLGRGTSPAMVKELLDAAGAAGVTTIDTADSYTSGRCERFLGEALAARRNDFFLMTKAGYRHGNFGGLLKGLNPFIKKAWQKAGRAQCFRPGYLQECLDRSLLRLKTDRVEGFLLHDPPAEIIAHPELVELLIDLKKSGKTLEIGISSRCPEAIRKVLGAGVYTILQAPLALLVSRDLESRWMGSGLRVVANNVFFSGKIPELKELEDLAARLGASRHELLMRYAASKPWLSSILVGTRRPEHLLQGIGWARNPLPAQDSARLDDALAPGQGA